MFTLVSKELFLLQGQMKETEKYKPSFKKWHSIHLLHKKINGTLINNSEDVYVLMPMYNLTEYNKSYSKAVYGIITENK